MKIIILCSALLWTTGTWATNAPESKPVEIARSYTLESKILGQTRTLNVYLPPGYKQSKTTYPVLYLLDGGVEEDFLHIMGIASLAAEFRNIRPFILVGIEGIDRYHDLIHPTTVKKEKEQSPTSGGSSAFRSFVGKELQPFVEKHFRVSAERVIMGESAAGMFVVETLLKEPGLFNGYIAVSPMLWWDNQSLAKSAEIALANPVFPANRRLYLTIANEGDEMQGGVDLLVAACKKKGEKDLNLTYAPMHEENHGTIFHPAALKAVRLFFKIK